MICLIIQGTTDITTINLCRMSKRALLKIIKLPKVCLNEPEGEPQQICFVLQINERGALY